MLSGYGHFPPPLPTPHSPRIWSIIDVSLNIKCGATYIYIYGRQTINWTLMQATTRYQLGEIHTLWSTPLYENVKLVFPSIHIIISKPNLTAYYKSKPKTYHNVLLLTKSYILINVLCRMSFVAYVTRKCLFTLEMCQSHFGDCLTSPVGIIFVSVCVI